MLLSEAIEALAVATLANGRSIRTADSYREKLSHLVAFLGDPPAEAVTVADLRRYVADLRGREARYEEHPYRSQLAGALSPATVASMVRAVKRLFNFLHAEGEIPSNPARNVSVARPSKGKAPKAIAFADLRRLVDVTAGDDPASIRDRAIVLFLADTGCRLGGLVGLRLADLDLARRAAVVTEKGDKSRDVYFQPITQQALARWLAVRPAGRSSRVFVQLHVDPGQALDKEGVDQILRRLKARAGIDGPVNAHSFRHAFAREYLSDGGDLATLSDLLGHSDITVTAMFYAVFLPSELQAKHDKHSPVNRLGREGEV
jgi:integrase/recombinase XerD